jgi:hypothetical protein
MEQDMENFSDLSVDDLKLLAAQGVPGFPDADYDIDEMQFVLGILYDRVQPFASYVLNRVNVWLEGDGRWGGDDAFEAAWNGDGAERSCILTRKNDGTTWIVDWSPKRLRPEVTAISISSYSAGLGSTPIAHGDISLGGNGAGGLKIAKGAVEAQMRLGAFDELCQFAQAIRPSMPDRLIVHEFDGDPDMEVLAYLPFVSVKDIGGLAVSKELLEADGGLPGRLCQARHVFVTAKACYHVGNWMRERLVPLAEGLRDVGAVWGKAVQSYNDGDYFCAVVDFADGSVGLFSDNAATGFDQHAYVARIRPDWESVGTVEVHLFDNDDDYQAKIAGIGEGAVGPAFVYDFEAKKPSFPGGRDGWTAMNLFFSQFVSDSIYALEEPNLDADCDYWHKPEGADIR